MTNNSEMIIFQCETLRQCKGISGSHLPGGGRPPAAVSYLWFTLLAHLALAL